MNKKSTLLSTLLLSAVSTSTLATDYYVSDATGTDDTATNDCLSWDAPCKSINYAVNIGAIKKGDVIHIAGGVYYPATITPAVDLTFIGGYQAGHATPNPDKFPTILSGDVGEDDIGVHPTDDSECKVNNVTTDHACIKNTNSSKLFSANNVDLTVKNLTITAYEGQQIDQHGPVLFAQSTAGNNNSVIFDNVSMVGNRGYSIGVIFIFGNGGEIDFSLNNSEIKANAGDRGGAVSIFGANAVASIEDTAFIKNDAINDGISPGHNQGYGGAIYVQGSSALTVDRSLFQENTASVAGVTGNGGGAIVSEGQTTITNSTFVGNSSDKDAGAVSIKGGNTSISYSTFYANHAQDGGAIFVNGGSLSLMADLILGNTVDGLSENIRTVSPVENSYTIVGSDGASGSNSIFVLGGSSFTSANAIDTIIEPALKDNGGALKSIKIHSNSEARNAIPNDGILSLGQGQSEGYPFTSVAMATGTIKSFETYTKGLYYFDLSGELFSTTVDDEGNVLVPSANEATITLESKIKFFTQLNSLDVNETWATGRGNCNGSITTLDGRGLPRSDYANPNDENQYGDVNDCDIGAFEFNDGYKFDCYSEDGDRPNNGPVIDVATGTVDFSRVTCIGGNLADLTPKAFLNNFGAMNIYWISLLGLLGLYRRKN
ncbi:MAG: hypothetical protein HRU20_29930 [Pseudomonadales bacterium]|nr:hypothetical protein [Pseudomonadales bacterium]